MGVEGKRLLVLGAGRGQIGLYKAAQILMRLLKKQRSLNWTEWLLAVWIQGFQLLEKPVIL